MSYYKSRRYIVLQEINFQFFHVIELLITFCLQISGERILHLPSVRNIQSNPCVCMRKRTWVWSLGLQLSRIIRGPSDLTTSIPVHTMLRQHPDPDRTASRIHPPDPPRTLRTCRTGCCTALKVRLKSAPCSRPIRRTRIPDPDLQFQETTIWQCWVWLMVPDPAASG